jgi:TM2 domain-containing membrane protein YozV
MNRPSYIVNRSLEADFWKEWTIWFSISFSFLVPGFGQMRLGEYKRGLVILIVGTGLLISTRLTPLEIGIIPMLIFYFWQIYDTFRLCRKKYPGLERKRF